MVSLVASFITLSVFDALGYIVMIFAMYKLPLMRYKRSIAVLVVCIAVFSYTMREVLALPKLDLPLQFIFVILYFRFVMKIKLHLSGLAVGTGLTTYISLQVLLYYFFNWLDLSQKNAIFYNTGFSVYVIQISSIVIASIIAAYLKIFGFGFSVITESTYDFKIKENHSAKGDRNIIVGATLSASTIILTLVFLYSNNELGFLFLAMISLIFSFYFSGKRDSADVRSAVSLYSEEN